MPDEQKLVRPVQKQSMCGSRGGNRGSGAPAKAQVYRVSSNTGPDSLNFIKIVSECDQEIPQSQTADKPMAPRRRVTQQSRDTRKTNLAKQPALSLYLFPIKMIAKLECT